VARCLNESQECSRVTLVSEAPMRKALELALLGPAYGINPQVGAVLTNDSGEILAKAGTRGWGTGPRRSCRHQELES
jgi:tRNA(Arg) A34 adenosine deaminase TadA